MLKSYIQSKTAGKKKVDKSSRLPAYAQLANIIRSAIASGEFGPGERLPAESAFAKSHQVSAMTARQAVSVLEEEGLVIRKQGKGTYVRRIGISYSNFGLDTLGQIFADKDNLSVRIINTCVKKKPGPEKEALGLKDSEPVILVERIILHNDKPFTLHCSFTRFDPTAPTVESMLDTVVLTELIYQAGYSNFKRGVLQLLPTQLSTRDSDLLQMAEGDSVFKLEHLFFDFEDRPAAYGWFLVSDKKMPMISKVGIWDE